MVHIFGNTYDTICSALKEKATGAASLRQSTSSRDKSAIKKAQQTAQKSIRIAPTSAHGYLASGHLYTEHDDFQAALAIYRRALQLVPTHDSQYYKLQQAEQEVLNALLGRNHGFSRMFPFDLLALIFSYLAIKDLLTCTSVCRTWCDIIMDLPEFWRKLSPKIPQTNKLWIKSLFQQQTNQFRLDGPVEPDLMYDLLLVLSESKYRCIQKLRFTNIHLTHTGATLLEKALRTIAPTLKQVKFIHCKIPDRQVFDLIFKACKSATYISFSQPTNAPNIPLPPDYIKPPSKKQLLPYLTIRNIERLYALTYLRLSFTYPCSDRFDIDQSQKTCQIVGLLYLCPNLVHLFLDSAVPINYGYCISQAMKNCSKLQSLYMSNKAKPITTTITMNEDDGGNNNKPKRRGLRQLVLASQDIQIGAPNDGTVGYIFNKCYKTLEVLHLRCRMLPVDDQKLFLSLVSCGGPHLREINLSTLLRDVDATIVGAPNHTDQLLATLFSKCPALEAITIDNIKPWTNFYSYSLIVSDHVLLTIAKNCPLIQHLHLVGKHYHTTTGLLNFATVGGTKLEELEIDMERGSVLDVVKKLKGLKTLHLRTDTPVLQRLGRNHKEKIEEILEQRGGSLIYN